MDAVDCERKEAHKYTL